MHRLVYFSAGSLPENAQLNKLVAHTHLREPRHDTGQPRATRTRDTGDIQRCDELPLMIPVHFFHQRHCLRRRASSLQPFPKDASPPHRSPAAQVRQCCMYLSTTREPGRHIQQTHPAATKHTCLRKTHFVVQVSVVPAACRCSTRYWAGPGRRDGSRVATRCRADLHATGAARS